MSTDTKKAAGGLEALQREAKANSQMETYNTVARAVHWLYAQALGEHIAAAKEREEKLRALHKFLQAVEAMKLNEADAMDRVTQEESGDDEAEHDFSEGVRNEAIAYSEAAHRLAAILEGGDDGRKA
jgi:hypothetical protein